MGLCVKPRGNVQNDSRQDIKLMRANRGRAGGEGVKPFLTQKETFLAAIFFFLLEKQHFLFPRYSLRRQLAIMTGFCK